MGKTCNQNLQRQYSILNTMFTKLDIVKESDFVENARRRLEAEGLLINQCPHWCESTEVLCKCILDAKPAPDCTIAGVVPGDFFSNEGVVLKFADIGKVKLA